MIKPITFACHQLIPLPAVEICANIADTTRWSEFGGYGVLPGIEDATYEKRTDDMVGSRIRVRNRDGSQHVEVIETWVGGEAVTMTLGDFTPPLAHLATHFTEAWHFEAQNGGTLVTRSFEMFPRRAITRPLVWLISQLFRRAIARHLTEMAQTA